MSISVIGEITTRFLCFRIIHNVYGQNEESLPISLLKRTVMPSSNLYSAVLVVFLVDRLIPDKELVLDLDFGLRGVDVPDAPSLKELFRLPMLLLALL